MQTIPYKYIPSYPIKKGNMYYFGSIYSCAKNEEAGMEILLSGKLETETETIYFTKGEIKEDYRDTIIKVIDIEKEEI